jgi:hypothetical protein
MMRLLELKNGTFSLTNDIVNDIPPYAILSHTWGRDNEEVTFKDLMESSGKTKAGYRKLQFCGQQATRDGLQYFWVDTCCINKPSKTELQKAINSMFCWYRNATRCYVYLSDVSTTERKTSDPRAGFTWNSVFQASRWYATRKASDPLAEYTWESAFQASRWFSRGWTLQELLAPSSVEFFSKEGKRLGDKNSLRQQIHEITGIPKSALRGAHLSQFSDKERFSWIECRKTGVEEDKAYSLLGIFGIEMPLRYGEGSVGAFKRLEEEIDKQNKILRDLRPTDPHDDKKRIENTKGGLLVDSYRWILDNPEFRRWREDQQSQLLWIKGDPGKGKTMLLCGIIDELDKTMPRTGLLSYFFCQATDSRINNATAVLRGLIHTLVHQQPSLISHIRKKHDQAGKTLFEDANAWVALSEIFVNILQDPRLNNTYLVVDALDECVNDLPKLLDFIAQKSSAYPRVKWIVSSRNWPSIEEKLNTATHKVWLCLELNEKSICAAVSTYIEWKVEQLAELKGYNNNTRNAIQRHLSSNASYTFLWVALVCQELANVAGWKAREKLTAFPPGLDALYRRMIDQIWISEDAELCKRILAVVSVVCRPITLDELLSFVDMPDSVSRNNQALVDIIGLCGSFLTLRERTISFIHQSAKDFLLKHASNELFPMGEGELHYTIFSKSLLVMSHTLCRDMYSLRTPGFPIDRVEQLDPDPLAVARYPCIYWVDHLCDWSSKSSTNRRAELQDGGTLDKFIRTKYLNWLEAISLCRSMSEGVATMAKLEALVQVILRLTILSIISTNDT